MKTQSVQVKNAILLFALLLVVWGFYRALFKLPETIEELVLKPLIWLGPVLYFLYKEKSSFASIGVTFKNLFQSIYLGIGLGVLFGLIALVSNAVKYSGSLTLSQFGFNDQTLFAALGISLVTAISEEVAFRGFIFNRLFLSSKSLFFAIGFTTLGWVIIHLPILIFVHHLPVGDILVRSLLTASFGIGSALLFARTQNIASSVLLSVLWSWPIILFR